MALKNQRQWYRFENVASDPTVAEIHIIDFIGSWDDDWIARNYGLDMGVTARSFVDQLGKLPEAVKTVVVHINSPGGDLQAGVNIANALREQQMSKGRTIETSVDGIAASSASIIAMAGSKVRMGDNALLMIHNPWTIGIGNAAEMRKVADILDTMRGQIINTYKWHSDLEPDAIAALMDKETWMNADEAIANGFATDKIEGLSVAASIDRRALAKMTIPEQYRARVESLLKPVPAEPVPATAADILRLCREGECLDQAEALITAGATLEQVQARVTETKTTRAAATARATEIRALCAAAKTPELADGYINGQMPVEDVRTHLTTITAKLDAVEIDHGLAPDARMKTITDGWNKAVSRMQGQLGPTARH